MTDLELKNLLGQGEGTRLEFKEARMAMPSSIFTSIVSLLNKEGGTILLGVTDDGKLSGIAPDCITKIKKDLVTATSNPNLISPPFMVATEQFEAEEKLLLSIKIPCSSQVHTYKGRVYDRENDSDIKVSGNGHLGEIYFRKRSHFSESVIYPGLKKSDFRIDLFEKAKAYIRLRRADHPWLEDDFETMAHLSGLFKQDYQTGENGYTLAAALVMGKDEVIRSILPAYKLEAMVRRKDQDRYDDRITFRTNLMETYTGMMDFIRKHLPDRFFIEGVQRKDLREIIFREIIANLLIHREYTNGESSSFIIYPDRVETRNPNNVRFRGYLDPEKFQPYPKNPSISKFFIELGWAEEIGSGLRNVYKYLPPYSGGGRPVFNEDDSFVSKLPLKIYTLGRKAVWVLDFLELDNHPEMEELKLEMESIATRKSIAISDDKEALIFQLVSSWVQKGTMLESLRMAPKGAFWGFSKKKVPSLVDLGTKLLGKRILVIMKILAMVTVPISMDELMLALAYKNRKSFKDLYLNPIMENGLMERTHPENPRHPDQKYKLSSFGQRFLGGLD